MAFEWDAAKAASNLRKHGVDFADAVGVFHDPFALSRPDDASDEERFVGIGTDFLGRILVVVYTFRGSDVRIISARTAARPERLTYEAGLP
jgi:uncharacterized DUF497 family protein